MGFLNLSSWSAPQTPKRLPTGSFTIDATGKVLTSTLPQSFPKQQMVELGKTVVASFREAHDAGIVFSELVFNYAALKITAREMRGGAMIFIASKV
jgi:hypothetical protein